MKFRYKKYGQVLRPVIEIRVRGKKDESVRYEVLVDSGADLCLFDAEIGEAVGIKVADGKPREVFMPQVAGRAMPYGLVGQRGFFDAFVVKFDLHKEEVELKQR